DRSSSTRCPTCPTGRGPRSGKSTSRRTWTGPYGSWISVSSERGDGGLEMAARNVKPTTRQLGAVLIGVVSLMLLTPQVDAHHSYAMYGGAVSRVSPRG